MRFILLSLLAGVSLAQICPGGQFTDADRNAILQYHNDLRSQIAKGTFRAGSTPVPAAANMQAMKWDCGVEASAQAYANTCPSGHSHAAGLGENLYWSWSTQPIPIAGSGVSASNSWANEFQQYGFPGNPYQGQSNVGHATQMIWSTSNLLGCGAKQCPSSQAGFQYQIVVVCQYKPQGNIVTVNMFQEGPTCSNCPTGTGCQQSTGLCVAAAAGPTGPAATAAPVVTTPRPVVTTTRLGTTTTRPAIGPPLPPFLRSTSPAPRTAPPSPPPFRSTSPAPATTRAPPPPPPPPPPPFRSTSEAPRTGPPLPHFLRSTSQAPRPSTRSPFGPTSTSRPIPPPPPPPPPPPRTSSPSPSSTYRPIVASTPPGPRPTTPEPIVEVTVPPTEYPPCYI